MCSQLQADIGIGFDAWLALFLDKQCVSTVMYNILNYLWTLETC